MPTLVRAASLTNYEQVALASGLNPTRMLLDVELSPQVLQAPDLMLPVHKVGHLLHASALRSGNDAFGLLMASSRLLSNLGPVGMLLRDQETLGAALRLMVRHLAVLNGALVLSLQEDERHAVMRVQLLAGSPGAPTRQRTELALGVLTRIIRQLIGAHWRPNRVTFEHRAPQDAHEHSQLFGCAVDFDQDINCLVFKRIDLATPIAFADPAMARYAQRLLDASPQLAGADALMDQMQRAILDLLPSGHCTVELVSAHLGVLTRTVQRRLHERGETFTGVVNDLRRQLVGQYVAESARSLTEVSELLGFAAASSFSRWHLKEFGCSAKQARENATTH